MHAGIVGVNHKDYYFASFINHCCSEHLGKSASSLFRHNLVGILETSLRSCNLAVAEYDEILTNLDVRLMEVNPSQPRQTGWDIFSLDYRVSFPLEVLLASDIMREYQRISQCLWNIKRAQHVLGQSWKRLAKYRHVIVREAEVLIDFKRMQMIMQEAIQLVEQIAIDAFESVNREWNAFEPMLQQSSSLMSLDHVSQQLRGFLVKARNSLVLWSNQVSNIEC